jgi:hypothetical protein
VRKETGLYLERKKMLYLGCTIKMFGNEEMEGTSFEQ